MRTNAGANQGRKHLSGESMLAQVKLGLERQMNSESNKLTRKLGAAGADGKKKGRMSKTHESPHYTTPHTTPPYERNESLASEDVSAHSILDDSPSPEGNAKSSNQKI